MIDEDTKQRLMDEIAVLAASPAQFQDFGTFEECRTDEPPPLAGQARSYE